MDIASILQNLGFDLRVFFFNVINFVMLIYLLKRFLFDKIGTIIDERERLITEGLSNAKKADESLELAEEEKKRIITEAKNRKEEIIEKAKNDARELSRDLKEKALRESNISIQTAQEQAKRIQKSAIKKVRDRVSEIVTKELENKITR